MPRPVQRYPGHRARIEAGPYGLAADDRRADDFAVGHDETELTIFVLGLDALQLADLLTVDHPISRVDDEEAAVFHRPGGIQLD